MSTNGRFSTRDKTRTRLFGHDAILCALEREVKESTLGHAYLFYGDEGIGKAMCAKLLAYALETGVFKETPSPLLDAHVLIPEEGETTIGVDAARFVKKFLFQKPFRSPRRTIIIPDAKLLTNEAQSALLKIVEEPPASSLILFVAEDPQILLPPLRSRVRQVYFRRIPKKEVAKILVEEYDLSPKEAERRALLSFGRLGRALRMEEQGKVTEEENCLAFLERSILTLWRKDRKRYAGLLRKLLWRESLITRYNVNMNLQKKAIQELLNSRL